MPAQLAFGLTPLDELTDVAADAGHHLGQFAVRRADAPAEELHHAQELDPIPNRETNRPVQALPGGDGRTGQAGLRCQVGNPGQCLTGPHTARQPDAWRMGPLPGVALKGRNSKRRRVPHLDTPQHVGAAVHRPQDANIPTQAFTDGSKDGRGGIVEGGRHR